MSAAAWLVDLGFCIALALLCMTAHDCGGVMKRARLTVFHCLVCLAALLYLLGTRAPVPPIGIMATALAGFIWLGSLMEWE